MKIDSIWHGRFWTGDPQRPEAKTVAVHNGRIIAIDEVDGLSARAEFSFGDARVIPGLHDAHHHTMGTGEQLANVDLRYPAVTNLDELYAVLEKRAQSLPAGAWVRGSGYDQNRLGGHPTAEGLDKVTGGRPAIIEHVSHHMIVANTAAFERVGATGRRNYADIPGGRVVRDGEGRAEGLLQETAGEPIQFEAAKVTEAESINALQLASQQSLEYGLTSLTEPGILVGGATGINSPVLSIYQKAIAENVLRPRMTVMPFHQVLHELELNADGMKTLDLGIRTGFGDERLKFGPVKIVSDGSLIGRSAAVHECYCGENANRGLMVVEPEELLTIIPAYHRAGWTVATHAIGDRAIDHALDGIAAALADSPRTVRHRIEHFAIATDEQVKRAADLGVIPVPQGVFISEFGDGILSAIGAERSQGTYRMRSLLDAGIVVPGSTDSPVSDANPFVSMHDLVNRKTSSGADFAPSEKVTIAEALRAYTYGSAYAVDRENEVGTLQVGQLADFVCLSQDILAVDSPEISSVVASATVIGGELLHGEAR
ncbi:amidohydrolase [Brevibacterium sp. UCMA 11754]|uniref:amidohydrolase n=1 Tax=Brevibacterium sp. UCMA 11754 TaxID=2749198 RepID=UPI001F3CE8F6|nr:amidohydrolase [Brevibacterium sp. UCMA 11754]MCF2573575.1 amidohydrolase [Brevibacterium sp. UCMA 11754]